MIDFHNHILPNVDDGSKSFEMSINMLKNASDQGITDVINTVHYFHPKVKNRDITLENISRVMDLLRLEIENHSIPIKIHCGAEIFFRPNLIGIKDDPLATFLNGKYMLIEFEPYQLPIQHRQELFDLKMAGVTPIIAHPERYRPVQKDIDIISNWLEAGCIIQVDAGSLLGYFGSDAKMASEKIINNKWCQILGSDSHNDGRRNFCLKNAMELISDVIDTNMLVLENPKKVLNGEDIIVDVNYEERKVESGIINQLKNKIGLKL